MKYLLVNISTNDDYVEHAEHACIPVSMLEGMMGSITKFKRLKEVDPKLWRAEYFDEECDIEFVDEGDLSDEIIDRLDDNGRPILVDLSDHKFDTDSYRIDTVGFMREVRDNEISWHFYPKHTTIECYVDALSLETIKSFIQK
jgi:hypothetical protein